jgi:hypothetical protein
VFFVFGPLLSTSRASGWELAAINGGLNSPSEIGLADAVLRIHAASVHIEQVALEKRVEADNALVLGFT